jgi:hypothetical protein
MPSLDCANISPLFFLHMLHLCAGSWVCAQRPTRVTLPEDATRQEAKRVNNERRHVQKQRRWLRSAAYAATRARGEETPYKLEFSGDDEEEDEDEEEGEIISSPCSLPPKSLPSLGDIHVRGSGAA